MLILKKLIIPVSIMVTTMNLTAILPSVAHAEVAGKEKTIICIDPGHGGSDKGAEIEYDGTAVLEKYINLNIAKKLSRALSQYEDVEVILTRSGDKDISIKDRVDLAAKANADVIISLHNNQAHDPQDRSIHGCMVLVPVSRYQPAGCKRNIHETGNALGESIIDELQELGLPLSTDFDTDKTGGLLRRPYNRKQGLAKKDVRYPDGSWADYYGLIRMGTEAGLPVVIVEHAYVSNEDDYRTYLKYSDSLQSLAEADARGIANALGLKK